jgi:hypothetical protein
LKRRAYIPALLGVALAAYAACAGATGDPIAAHLAAIREALDPRAAGALTRIDGMGRQLLAARSYLRADANLAERWSWSDAEITDWQGSAARSTLAAAIARVRSAFESANPGFTLHVNSEVRSLEIQLERWNTNESIAAAARALSDAVAIATQSQAFPAPGTPLALAAIRDFLRGFVPSPTPPLAAPGLSAHGQMRAVDFVVMQGDRIVAGAVTADIPVLWAGQGWADRLRAAVAASGAPFVGPLRLPDEPWHYDYRP